MESLEVMIAADLATWERGPIVHESLFGTRDPGRIVSAFDDWCFQHLGGRITSALFHHTSVGCVAGLVLGDGKRVVVKTQRRQAAYLDAVHEVQRHLANHGFPCPRPLVGPRPIGERGAIATAEALLDRGARGDPHDPEIRRLMASSLAELIHRARPLASGLPLGRAWYLGLPEGRLWPTPHSPLFDFVRTAEGAEWIDAIAAKTLERRTDAAGDLLIGHFDWRVEHLRFENGRVVATYDWDTLHTELETVCVGTCAHAFTADWQIENPTARVPTLEEIWAFVSDYEDARGRPFQANERDTIACACLYSLAYTARCNHALSGPEMGGNGDFRPFLAKHSGDLLPPAFRARS